MLTESTRTIAGRELRTRLRSRAYWATTIALPLVILAAAFLPMIFLAKAQTSHRLVIVDGTGRLEGLLAPVEELPGAQLEPRVEPLEADVERQRSRLDRSVLDGELDAWILLEAGRLEDNIAEYRARNVSNLMTQEVVRSMLSEAVRRDRFEAEGIPPERAERLSSSITLDRVRIGAEEGASDNVHSGILLASALILLLFPVMLIYGQQVMNGVLEEKGSRIVEVLLAAARPMDLMMGKLMGICAAALLQLAIWLSALALLSAPAVLAAFQSPYAEYLPRVGAGLVLHFLALFTLGFFLFSALYAGIGAAFNSVQEAQQFAGFAVFPLVIPMFFYWNILDAPDSALAVTLSLIPPFTPLLMMLRIAVQAAPGWQIALGYALTASFTVLTVWVAARIYRVGILMYGKKPTLLEILRWVRR